MSSPADAVGTHRQTVRTLARPGGVLASDSPHASVNNPDWFDLDGPTSARRALHTRLIAQYRALHPQARQQRRAIVLAGPPGAGKSTVLAEVLGTDRPGWLTIDADEFKHALLREAIAEGTNVVIDAVLSNPAIAEVLGRRLSDAGYVVEVVDVEVPFEVSAARIAARWRASYEDALEHADGLGGRWVPSEYAREVFAGADGRSRSEESALRLARTCRAVVRYRVFRTPRIDAPRVLEVDLARFEPGGALLAPDVAGREGDAR